MAESAFHAENEYFPNEFFLWLEHVISRDAYLLNAGINIKLKLTCPNA
jgi:hypothetical protein